MLAHELRNPLGPIRNAAKILSLDPNADCDHAQARQVIERQVAHMGRLIDDLLDVSAHRPRQGLASPRTARSD